MSVSVDRGGEPAGAWPEDTDAVFYADKAMTLPGKEEPGAGCGEWYPKEFCNRCGEPDLGRSACQQRGCPDCWYTWARRRGEGIARRLGAAREAAEAGLSKRVVHAVMSPPEGEITTLNAVYDGFSEAYRLAEEKGVRGGVAVFHAFRVREKYRKEWAEETNRGSDGPKLWAWVREHERDWRELVYWSPHYHILGLSRDFEADDPEEQDGWVARRIRSLSGFQRDEIEGYEDMVGAAMYLLSHMAFESRENRDMVRWFGELSTAKFSPEEELAEEVLEEIEEMAAKAAAVDPKEEGEGKAEEEEPCGNCGATSKSPIWEAGYALKDEGWLRRIGEEQEARLRAAFEWAIGDRMPPPGLQNPQTEEQAEEAFEELL